MDANRNPQATQIADESMVRTLRHQIAAIWPQELPLLARYALPEQAQVLDVGCGTGEATVRLAARYSRATVIGTDVVPQVLDVARREHAALAPRVSFEEGDGFHLRFASASQNLVVCRHVTHMVPQPQHLLAELARVTTRGGWLHVLSEDYGMLHFPERGGVDPDRLWHEGAIEFIHATGTDGRIGRKTLPLMRELGFTDLRIDFLAIDTERVARETLIGIFTAWRDGYTDALAGATRLARDEVLKLFACVLGSLGDPNAYAVWQVPVVSGRRA
jgi:SAM-dependent methyltransferase